MACGMIAFRNLGGLIVEKYDAYEIDKYAIKTSMFNFPDIIHHGDVFDADFTLYENVDYLIGGSPCTYWSIAQKNNRETEASGMGWELFSQYVRALHEAKPKFFIYENNKSMSKQIRSSITKTFGFDAICINSALVSAQNRQRLYWVGKRNADGTYSQVSIEQPEDRGVLLRDILESVCCIAPIVAEPLTTDSHGKAWTLTTSCCRAIPEDTIKRHRHTMVAEPVNITADGKSQTLKAQYAKNSIANFCGYTSTYGATGVAEPVRIETIKQTAHGYEAINAEANKTVSKAIDDIVEKKGYLPELFNPYNRAEITTKSLTLSTGSMVTSSCATLVIEAADGKTYPVYEIKDGQITIKGKQYPVRLVDGFYIIRKLTVTECKRLQTVPDDYVFPVSDTQAYKMLGNGWTCDVISHLIKSTLK